MTTRREWARKKVEKWDEDHSAHLQRSLTEWQFDEIVDLLKAERARARRVLRQMNNERLLGDDQLWEALRRLA